MNGHVKNDGLTTYRKQSGGGSTASTSSPTKNQPSFTDEVAVFIAAIPGLKEIVLANRAQKSATKKVKAISHRQNLGTAEDLRNYIFGQK